MGLGGVNKATPDRLFDSAACVRIVADFKQWTRDGDTSFKSRDTTSVPSGNVMPSPASVERSAVPRYRSAERFAKCLSFLNDRERDILQWVRLGKTNGEIAQIACMSESTLEHYMTQIFDKVRVSNRAQLMARLMEHESREAQRGS